MTLLEISEFVDARGLPVGDAVALVDQALRDLPPGKDIEVVASDPECCRAFEAWSRLTGNRVMDATSDGTTYRFVVQRH